MVGCVVAADEELDKEDRRLMSSRMGRLIFFKKNSNVPFLPF